MTRHFAYVHLSQARARGFPVQAIQASFSFRNPARVNRVYWARRRGGFPTLISCQPQDKLCDVSTVPLVARWPVFLPADLTRTATPIGKVSRTREHRRRKIYKWGGGILINVRRHVACRRHAMLGGSGGMLPLKILNFRCVFLQSGGI